MAIALARAPDAVLLIRRATRPGDPWSGDWAFPGGFGAPGDEGPLATARREAREELGDPLGDALDAAAPVRELASRHLIVARPRMQRVRLVPLVFELPTPVALHPAPAEVARARWVPRAALSGRRRQWIAVRGWLPWWAAVRPIDGEDGRVWGLTGGMLDELWGHS